MKLVASFIDGRYIFVSRNYNMTIISNKRIYSNLGKYSFIIMGIWRTIAFLII